MKAEDKVPLTIIFVFLSWYILLILLDKANVLVPLLLKKNDVLGLNTLFKMQHFRATEDPKINLFSFNVLLPVAKQKSITYYRLCLTLVFMNSGYQTKSVGWATISAHNGTIASGNITQHNNCTCILQFFSLTLKLTFCAAAKDTIRTSHITSTAGAPSGCSCFKFCNSFHSSNPNCWCPAREVARPC